MGAYQESVGGSVKVSIMCPACNGAIVVGDKFCEKCGAKVTAEQEASLRERLEHSSGDMAEHMKQVRAARQTIMVLAVMFVLGGVVMYFIAQGTVETAAEQLERVGREHDVPAGGSGPNRGPVGRAFTSRYSRLWR